MSMRILVISQFFPPEMGAPAARFLDFGRHWTRAGHQVRVVTTFPNWPSGTVFEEYRGKLHQEEEIEGIRVSRGYIYSASGGGFLKKILGYITFALSASLIVLFSRIKCDVVISTSPPLTVGIPGVVASWLKRVPLVFDVRDIWPESAAQLGMVKNRPLIRFLEHLERFLYRQSRLVTVVTDGKIEKLEERGVDQAKVALIRNGVDLKLFDEKAKLPLPRELEEITRNRLCITYAGVFNIGQALDVVLESVSRLRDESPEYYEKVAFILIGDGPIRQQLETMRADLGLDNVRFTGLLPREIVFAVLKRSFGTLVTLCPRPDIHTVPSKLYEAMAAGRPVLLSAEGEPAAILESAGGGTVCRPGEAQDLTDALVGYLRDPQTADSHGQAGRRYCEKHFDREDLARQYAEILVELTRSEVGQAPD